MADLLYSNEPTKVQWEEREHIVNECDEKGFVTVKQAKWLEEFDYKYRRCNSCKRSYKEVLASGGAWALACAPDRYGKTISIGLFCNCLECDVKRIMQNNPFEKQVVNEE